MRKTILILILTILVSCRGHKNKHHFQNDYEKEFYTDCNGMDYIRLPLISPYEVMNADFVNKNWVINLQRGFEFYSSINMVSKIGVTHNVIFVYSASTHSVTEGNAPLKWFVIIPSEKIEIGFSTALEFENYMQKYGIIKFEWIDVDVAYTEFKNTECLPWIPGCGE